jgi:hypothetical protein
MASSGSKENMMGTGPVHSFLLKWQTWMADLASTIVATLSCCPDGKVLNGLAAQGLYKITLREECARLNKLTGSLTLSSGVQASAADKSIVDSLEGTVVWEYDSMACPQTIVRLY